MRREEFPVRSVLVLVSLAALLWGMDMAGWLSGVRRASETLVGPVRGVFGRLGQGTYALSDSVRRVYRSQARVADLERQVGELQIQVAQVERLKSENTDLRQALGLKTIGYILVSAKVVGVGDGLLVSVTSGGTVKPGMAVVSQAGGLVGVIETVGEFTAKVETIGGAGFAVMGVTSGGTRGVISGTGSGVELRQVLQAEVLTEGDVVVTQGEDQVPSGIAVGAIGRIYQMPSEVYKTSAIKPVATPQVLDTVMIITGRQL